MLMILRVPLANQCFRRPRALDLAATHTGALNRAVHAAAISGNAMLSRLMDIYGEWIYEIEH